MRDPAVFIDFNDFERDVYANDPSSMGRIEYLTKEAFGGEPCIVNFDYYVVADSSSYKAHAMVKLSNFPNYLDETQEEIVRAYAEDKWGEVVIYLWHIYDNDWRLLQ